MSEIRRYADGSYNSTSLLEDEMERSGQITRGERNDMHWHAGAETQAHAMRRMKGETAEREQPGERGKDFGTDLAKDLGKDALKLVLQNPNVGWEEALHHLAVGAAKGLVDVNGIVIKQGVDCAKLYYDAIQDGDMLHTRANEESLEVLAVSVLDVDPRFRDAELAHHEGIVATRTAFAMKNADGTLTPEGKKVVPLLQAAADSGARAALTALATQGRDEFLRTHPDVARRLAVDVAYNVGFENAMSIAKDAAALRALSATIDARNPWTVADLAVRG